LSTPESAARILPAILQPATSQQESLRHANSDDPGNFSNQINHSNLRKLTGFRQISDLWSALTRHRFLFQIIWLWERRLFVLPTSPETSWNVDCFPRRLPKMACEKGKAATSRRTPESLSLVSGLVSASVCLYRCY
jgi:hypothetical protein